MIIHELSHAVCSKSGHGKEFVKIFYEMTDEFLIRVFDGTLKSYMFTDVDDFNNEEKIEIISRQVERNSCMEKKNLTIAKLKKKLGLKILR